MTIDVLQRDDLLFPHSLPEFQRLFPDEAACASYLERSRWKDGFVCPNCHASGDPYRFTNRSGILRCRHCQHNTYLTAGTVMERSHTPLMVWFWAAYLITSQDSRYVSFAVPETAWTFALRDRLPNTPQAPC